MNDDAPHDAEPGETISRQGETIYRDTPYFQGFPDPESVFANRVQEHAEYLLPLATLSLNHLSDEWQGKIHFIAPIEPWKGLPGDGSEKYHNYLCRTNWLGYRMLGDKCEFAADFRYFHRALYAENPPTDDFDREEAEALGPFYLRKRKEFEDRRAFYHRHGWLCGDREDLHDQLHRCFLAFNVGGVALDGFWSNPRGFSLSKYPHKDEYDGEVRDTYRVVPKTEDGRDFHFIGEMTLYTFTERTYGNLLLFYDPIERIALTAIDWS